MEKVRVMYDKEGNTLDVWFEEPRAAIAEETGEEVILKKDPKTGKVIGFEKLNFLPEKLVGMEVEVEEVKQPVNF